MTAEGDAADYVFTCPACSEEMAVNASMREALLEEGCVICGAGVTGAAFRPKTDE